MLRSGKRWSRIFSSRMNSTGGSSKNRHDLDGNIDEVIKGNQQYYGKDAKWTNYFLKGKDYRKEKREFDRMSYDKMHKDVYYAEAARKMRGFYYEHSAGWVIEDYGQPLDVISCKVIFRSIDSLPDSCDLVIAKTINALGY